MLLCDPEDILQALDTILDLENLEFISGTSRLIALALLVTDIHPPIEHSRNTNDDTRAVSKAG